MSANTITINDNTRLYYSCVPENVFGRVSDAFSDNGIDIKAISELTAIDLMDDKGFASDGRKVPLSAHIFGKEYPTDLVYMETPYTQDQVEKFVEKVLMNEFDKLV